MSGRWLISVPVWGDRYVEEFCAVALPGLSRAVEALRAAGRDARLIVHTDQPERVVAAAGCPTDARPVPAGARGFDCMSQAHREVLGIGLRGDVVVLLTAGAVVSERSLVHCADVLENPRLRAVLCAVPRVLASGPLPDTGDAQALMSWAWDNRHPMTRECTWPDGRSADLSRTYFEGAEGGVVTRQALPHPLAVRIDGRPLPFTPTVDANLFHCFDPIEMHVVTDCAELAVIKLTPADKGFDRVCGTVRERARAGILGLRSFAQRWSMAYQIVIRPGPGTYGDGEFVEAMFGGGAS